MPLVCLDTFVQPFSWKDNFLQSLALTQLLRGFVSKYAYIHTIKYAKKTYQKNSMNGK